MRKQHRIAYDVSAWESIIFFFFFNMSFFTSHEASHQLRKKTNSQSKLTTITTHTCNSTRSPPFLPSYLNQTFYAKLMDEEQCTYKQKKTPSIDLRLPTSWNPNDKSKNIEIHHNGLGLSYIGNDNT